MNSKKALKRLFLNSYTIEELSVIHSDLKDYDLVLQDLDKLEKLKKVIEILKNKNVYICELLKSKNLFDYNSLTWDTYDFNGIELTEEEYNLLKEVLGNETNSN